MLVKTHTCIQRACVCVSKMHSTWPVVRTQSAPHDQRPPRNKAQKSSLINYAVAVGPERGDGGRGNNRASRCVWRETARGMLQLQLAERKHSQIYAEPTLGSAFVTGATKRASGSDVDRRLQ